MAFLEAAGAERVRHQRVEPQQQPHREHDDGREHRAADADGPDRLRAEPPDHQRVDDAHRHPTELGEDDRHREHEHRPELGAQVAGARQHREPPMISSAA